MTADEIRDAPILREFGGSADPSAFFLREIAAQLADLNQALERLTSMDGQVFDVRVNE